jgi:hypothetical protein
LNRKSANRSRKFHLGITAVTIFIFMVSGMGGLMIHHSRAAVSAENRIYLPLILRNYTYTTTQYLTVSKSGTGSGMVTSSPAGIDCGATCSYAFAYNTSVTLSAVAAVGSTFSGWNGAGCSGTGACTVTMGSARSVTATFAQNTYTLVITKDGTGSGTITSSPSGINCGAICSYAFAYNTSVTLTAVASAGSTFSGWSDSNCPANGTCSVTMDAARSVTATFSVTTFQLRVGISGAGSGTVTSNPVGIDCGANCITSFPYNTVVTLTAVPTAPAVFGGWSGGPCSGTGECQLPMDADYAVVANFLLTCNGIANCSFEAGSDGEWSELSAQDLPLIFACDDPDQCTIFNGIPPHSGMYLAWLGGVDNETSSLQQQVYINSNTPYLVYWEWIESIDVCGVNHDYTEVLVNGLQVQKYDLCTGTNTTTWVPHTINLGAYANQSVTLQIRVKTNLSNYSSLYLDDFSLQENPLTP